MKKVIRLTESDLTQLVKRVIEEQKSQRNSFGCDRNQTLKKCLLDSKFKGNPTFDVNKPTQLFSTLYLVQPGDTWNGIMNRVLSLDGFYGVGKPGTPAEKQYAIKGYERYSNFNLEMNPKLNNNKKAIKPGDILHLEGPYD
jgi:hypothetical protein